MTRIHSFDPPGARPVAEPTGTYLSVRDPLDLAEIDADLKRSTDRTKAMIEGLVA